MKKIILMILIIYFSFLISCTKNVDVNVTKDDTDVIKRLDKAKDISKEFKVLVSSKSKSKKIYANEYLLPVPTGGEIGDQTSYKDRNILYSSIYEAYDKFCYKSRNI